MTATARIETIVAATDFSVGSGNAVEQAALLAKRWGARLVLLHVFNDGAWSTLRSLYQAEHWARREPVLAARDRLSQQAAELGARHNIVVTAETRTGRAAAEIAAFAAECGAQLLVVGEHGEDWLGDTMIGGTALKLLEQAGLPVLLARRPAGAQYANLLVGVDFSDNALRAAHAAHVLFPDARLMLSHAYMVSFEGRMRLAGATDADIEGYRRNERIRAEQKMQDFLASLDGEARLPTSLITRGFPPAVLFEQAAELDIDLIVVGRHGGGRLAERLLGSVTQNVLYQSACDVLLVP